MGDILIIAALDKKLSQFVVRDIVDGGQGRVRRNKSMTLKPHFFPPQTLASLHSSSNLTEIFMLSEKLTWFVKKFTFLQSILTFESASMTNVLTCLQTRFHATWQVTE